MYRSSQKACRCKNGAYREERAAYFEDVARVARAIMKAFNPDKVNYGAVWRYRTSSSFSSLP